MVELHSSRDGLPSEIYNCILQYVDTKYLFECALICKAWLPPVRNRLYSIVCIKHFEQLGQFYQTVEQDPRLGMKVKSLILRDFPRNHDWEERDNITDGALNILTPLLYSCLPRLESLQDDTGIAFTPLLLALKESQLTLLRKLEPLRAAADENELAIYISCALLIKDRLENLLITDLSRGNGERLYSDPLYSKLGQFCRLKELNIERSTGHGIPLLEYVVESCPSLESIEFYFKDEDDLHNNSDTFNDRIENFTPCRSVKKLRSPNYRALDETFLVYVMHKFPQLKEFGMSYGGETPLRVSQQVLKQFLHYLHRRRRFSTPTFTMNHDIIIDTINSHWVATLSKCKKHVEFCFSEYVMEEGVAFSHTDVTIYYPVSNNEHWKYVDFLKQNGRFLTEVHFSFEADDFFPTDRSILPDDAFAQAFAHCPNIQEIWLEEFTVVPINAALRDEGKEQYSLRELFLLCCKIQEGGLESVSAGLSHVKHLQVYEVNYAHIDMNKIIRMPYTVVDMLTIGVFIGGSRFVHFYNVTDGKVSYYALYSDKKDALPSTEEDYFNAPECDRVQVCFKTNVIIKCELVD